MELQLKTKKINPKFTYKSSEQIKKLASETADKIYGIDNLIPPIADNTVPFVRESWDESVSLSRTSLFTDNFWDCFLSLSLICGFISFGLALGSSLR